ncbi:sugar transporter [Lindgomyces ingoldianus]|uniref:Sugar transporter n=1 Tax=Lindgomyces ingoldianus TaxID=673940 RepID=A0ACB6R2C3_9PLEO|nr:sugar transporter [Lindgomyces ingoldianus]KAF2472596.1 sugar transporter [Lindgomyces ingoldianus]
MAEKVATNARHMSEKELTEDGRKILEEGETFGVNPTFAAIMVKHKPNPWGKGHLMLYLLCTVCFLNSTMSGFDSSLMGSINVLENYTNYYNLPSKGTTSTGIVFSIFQIGQMCAALFVWIADWLGRKWFIFIGTIGVIVGAIVTATAQTLPTFIGGRFLLSFFATCACSASPLYLVEVAPPQYRGTLAGLYNTFYYFGSILATSSVYGAHKHLSHKGNIDWRLPLWLQMVCPAFVSLVILSFPESPRWLVGKDRHEEARAFLVKYHANGDPDHPLVNLEMAEMIDSLQRDPVTNWRNFFNLRVLFKTRARRYRTMLNMTFAWFGQFSGNNVVSYYLPYLLANVGIKDADTKLLLNIIYAIVGYIFSSVGARMHDVIGRRKMLLGATAGLIVSLSVTAGTAAGYVNTGSKASSSASIAFIFVFGAIFAFAFTSMQPIYPAEVMANDMRAKGMGTYKITGGCAGFINTFAAPIALTNIGYWFYVFFVFWDCFEFFFMYFFFVETKGLTLEEMDEIFEAKNPRKASTDVKKVKIRTVLGTDGKVEEEVGV